MADPTRDNRSDPESLKRWRWGPGYCYPIIAGITFALLTIAGLITGLLGLILLIVPVLVGLLLFRNRRPARCAGCGQTMNKSVTRNERGQMIRIYWEFRCPGCHREFSVLRKQVDITKIR